MASGIRTVMGIKGEPATPTDPAQGLVWRAIVEQVDVAGSESAYVSVADTPRATFAKHPWSIGGGGAADLKERIEEGRLTSSKLRIPLSITFAFVATHNHFVLDRGGKVFNRSAPVIKLPAGASEDDHLGLLNASVACFWLKQVCHDKGNGGIGGGIALEDWERFYEFTGAKMSEFPLADPAPTDLARTLDRLAQEHAACLPAALLA